jgi:hypothetical protein
VGATACESEEACAVAEASERNQGELGEAVFEHEEHQNTSEACNEWEEGFDVRPWVHNSSLSVVSTFKV